MNRNIPFKPCTAVLVTMLLGVGCSSHKLPDKTILLWEVAEWSLTNPGEEDNPFDLIADVIFTRKEGETRKTQMFYDGGNTWKFRFCGTMAGEWHFSTSAQDSDLDGYRGSIKVVEDPDHDANGFITNFGNKWACHLWMWGSNGNREKMDGSGPRGILGGPGNEKDLRNLRYLAALKHHPEKPSFEEDRFRLRNLDRWSYKDYNQELTRRGLWHSALAGGVANIWGNLLPESDHGGSRSYESGDVNIKHQIKTYADFFRKRFLREMETFKAIDPVVLGLRTADMRNLIFPARFHSVSREQACGEIPGFLIAQWRQGNIPLPVQDVPLFTFWLEVCPGYDTGFCHSS